MNLESLRILSAVALFAMGLAACKSRNNPQMIEPPADVPPAEYGQPGDEVPMPEGQQGRGGRFGYTGDERSEAPLPPRSGDRDVREMDEPTGSSGRFGSGNQPKKEEEKKQPSGPPASTNMPFANKVPGNPLVVTLPGANSSLGQISIEKYDSSGNPTGQPLKRGTQVQIPDPNNPGKKIYFKVP